MARHQNDRRRDRFTDLAPLLFLSFVILGTCWIGSPALGQLDAPPEGEFLAIPPESPQLFTSIPPLSIFVVLAVFGLLGVMRGLFPGHWEMAVFRWPRDLFTHLLRIGWLSFIPALVLDALIFFTGGEFSHSWTILILSFVLAPFAAGLQWEKAWWNARKDREEAYPLAFNYYMGIALTVLIPAVLLDLILYEFSKAGQLQQVALPFNLLALGAAAGSVAFGAAKLFKVLVKAIILPHRLALFLFHPTSRYYALILVFSLVGMAAFNYFTLPFFIEIFSATQGPVPALNLDQAIIILIPNIINIIIVTYFSIFAGVFISMLPVILFSRSLRKKPPVPPTLDVLLKDPEKSKEYLGRELKEEEIWPTVVTVTAYNEPAEPLEKTLYGYVRIARDWVNRGLPRDRFIILFSHQTEREEERLEFEKFLRERYPDADPRHLIERDWSRFDEDDPNASILDESRLFKILNGWLQYKKLDPDSKAGRGEFQKRRICQRLYEFSCHAPREIFKLPDPPLRTFGPQTIDSWIWYYLIPKQAGGHLLQVTSKAHNLYYAREGIWGKAEESPLGRDGIYRDFPEWLFDASDADSEIHESCVNGILASYTPFYKEPNLGWLQRLSYTIEPSATFLSAVKSASEMAYWSWYLRARVHTYTRKGKPLIRKVGDVFKPIRRDFQAANGHNMVVRGTSIQAAGGDIEHEVAKVHDIESPLKRWVARLKGKRDPSRVDTVERWVPTGEDLELATRMALEGYYGDYGVYAPQGEGSPADFRGNVPQAIRWSGNNVQLIFMHLTKVFSSKRLTFNEKMGYFVNLATLASAPLLYLAVLRAVVMPFLEIPDVYSTIHPGLGPFAFLLALAPNFLLLALALSGQLVVKTAEPWQRIVLKPWHVRFLQWMGYLVIPPLTILVAALLPGWLKAVKVSVSDELAWILVGYAILFNLILLFFRRRAFAGLAYVLILLPFLQVLYLAWIIFGIMGCINMIVKTQIVEPYLSRLVGTFRPPVAGRYPSDSGGRFLPMNQRYPWLFAPFRWMGKCPWLFAPLLGTAAGFGLWKFLDFVTVYSRENWHFEIWPQNWSHDWAGFACFLILGIWLCFRLRTLLNDWFLDRDCLVNRWWDYWTNPQAAFVKTIKERQERSLSTLIKDNIYGILNGIVILVLILSVHLIHAGGFSAALIAYLTFSIGASWIISPFFYEEPHRTGRSQRKAFFIALILVLAFLALPAVQKTVNNFFGEIKVIRDEMMPWLEVLLGTIAIAGLVNLAPWSAFRAFAKRFTLAVVMLGLLFLSGLAVSYRGVSVEPLQESWALEADRDFTNHVLNYEISRSSLKEIEERVNRAELDANLSFIKEQMARNWRENREGKLAEAERDLFVAELMIQIAADKVELELQKSRFQGKLASLREIEGAPGSRESMMDALEAWMQGECERRRNDYRKALEMIQEYGRELEQLKDGGGNPEKAKELEEFLEAYQVEIVETSRKGLEGAENLLQEIELERENTSSDPRQFLANFKILSSGDLSSALEVKNSRERKLEVAREFLEKTRREVLDAEEAYQSAQDARLAASMRYDDLNELLLKERRKVENYSALQASLTVTVKDRVKFAFFSRPNQFDATFKNLAQFRQVLEDPLLRNELLKILGEVGEWHWTKKLSLNGAPWYPRKPSLVERLQKILPLALERMENAQEEAREARRRLQSLIAKTCLKVSIQHTRNLLERGALQEAEVQGLADVEELLDRGENLFGNRAPAKSFLLSLEVKQENLKSLEEDAREAAEEIQLARAGLESYLNLSSQIQDPTGELDLLEPLMKERLQKRQCDLIRRYSRQLEREKIERQSSELEAWRSVFEENHSRFLFGLFSTTPVPSMEDLLSKDEIEAFSSLFTWAITETNRAQKGKDRLELEEDQILSEVDRLEPCLIGIPLPENGQVDLPSPLAFLRKSQLALEEERCQALEALSKNLKEEVAERREKIIKTIQPRRDRLKAELLEDLRVSRSGALIGLSPLSPNFFIPPLYVWNVHRAIETLELLFDGNPESKRMGSSGYLDSLKQARGESDLAKFEAHRNPDDLYRKNVYLMRKRRVENLEVKARDLWNRLRNDLELVLSLESLFWRDVYERHLDAVSSPDRIEECAKETVKALLENSLPRDVIREQFRFQLNAMDRLNQGILEEDEIEDLFVRGIQSDSYLVGDPLALREKARYLEKEISRLEKEISPESSSEAVPRLPVAGEPESPKATGTLLSLQEAVDAALEQARKPGGILFLARKDVEIALQELKNSGARIYPEIFGTLGASSSAPAIFQGGGFGLVMLSLDLWKNREVFEHQEEQKKYLMELAELLTVLRAVRASGQVLAAERELSLLRQGQKKNLETLEQVRGIPGSEAGGEIWLALEKARLETSLAAAQAKLSSKKRILNALLGRPLTREFTLGFEKNQEGIEEKARIDSWLEEAGALIQGQFPQHPAFQAARASIEKFQAQGEEADLKGHWPVLYAGAGAAAPSENPFTVGASLIVPFLDRGSRLDEETAASEARLVLNQERERIAQERERQNVARVRHSMGSRQMARRDLLLEAHKRAIQGAIQEYRHGFTENTIPLASEVEIWRRALEAAAGLYDPYIESGLDLLEAGASLGQDVGGEEGWGMTSSEGEKREFLGMFEEGASTGGIAAFPIDRQRERISFAQKKFEHEDRLLDRIGLGAGVSYSTMLIPLPGVEVVYGKSLMRREAAEAGLEYEKSQLVLAELQNKNAILQAHLGLHEERAYLDVLIRKAELRSRHLEQARGLERQGRESALSVELARKRLQEVEQALEGARGQVEAKEAYLESLLGKDASQVDFSFTREGIDQALSPQEPFFLDYRETALTEAKAAEVEYRFRQMAAAIENKKPYGGNVGNFFAPLWDAFRLWWRPGTPEEIEAALSELRDSLIRLESSPGASEREDLENFREALRKAKKMLAGDRYDLKEVEEGIRKWRAAEVELEIYQEEIPRRRELAQLNYRASLSRLKSLKDQVRRIEMERIRRKVSGLLRRPDQLALLLLEEDLLDLELKRARALGNYARARAGQVYFMGILEEESPDSPPVKRTASMVELVQACLKQDPEVSEARIAVASREWELQLTEKLRRMDARLQTEVPSFGLDPRFGGAGLASSVSFTPHLERYRQLDALQHDLLALREEAMALEIDTALKAIQDALEVRLARERVTVLETELKARQENLVLLEAGREADEVSPLEVLEAEERIQEILQNLELARWELREREESIAARAGGPVTIEFSSGEAGDWTGLGEEIQSVWKILAFDANPRREAAAERARKSREESKWSRRESWLTSKLDAVFSLGQTPDDAEVGGGGFLAIPFHYLLGLKGSRTRIEEIQAEKFEGEKEWLDRQGEERIEMLVLKLEETGKILERRRQEVRLANILYQKEESLLKEGLLKKGLLGAGRRSSESLRGVSKQFLGSLEGLWLTQLDQAAAEGELRRLWAAHGKAEPLPVARDSGESIPLLPSAVKDHWLAVAGNLVEELTALPLDDQEQELEEIHLRLELAESLLDRVDSLSGKEVFRELGLFRSLQVAQGALSSGEVDPALSKKIPQLLQEAEVERSRSLQSERAQTLGERETILPFEGEEDLESSGEELFEELFKLQGPREEIRAALEDHLERRKEMFLRKSQVLEEYLENPNIPRIAPERLGLKGLELEEWLRNETIPPAQAREIQESLALLEEGIRAVRRAKILDGFARSEIHHQGRLREKVGEIDLHGLYRRTVDAWASFLQELNSTSPALDRSFLLNFRRKQLALLESRLSRALPPEEHALMKEWAAVLPVFENSLSGGETASQLQGLVALREELNRLLGQEALGLWSSRWERDLIARRLGSARALQAASQAAEVRRNLEREAQEFFRKPEVQDLVPKALKELCRTRLALVESEMDLLQKHLTRIDEETPGREEFPVERALRFLEKAARREGELDSIRRNIREVRQSVKDVRRDVALWRINREQLSREGSQTLLSLEKRVQGAREALRRKQKLARSTATLESAWNHLLEKVQAMNVGAPSERSLLQVWREDLARASAWSQEWVELDRPRKVAWAIRGLTGEDPVERRRLSDRLQESFPSHVEGAEKLKAVLEKVDRACRLKKFGNRIQELLGKSSLQAGDLKFLVEEPECLQETAAILGKSEAEIEVLLKGVENLPLTVEPSQSRLEDLLRRSVKEEAVSEAELKELLESLAEKAPACFYPWVRAEGLAPPPLLERLSALESAQNDLSREEEDLRQLELALSLIREEKISAIAWQKAGRGIEQVRREIFKELTEDDEWTSRGYLDRRGQFLKLTDLVNTKRFEKAWENLARWSYVDFLKHDVMIHEIQTFLDRQILVRRDEVIGESGRPGAKSVELGYSRTYGERDESYTFQQALHAMACLLLDQADQVIQKGRGMAGGLGTTETILPSQIVGDERGQEKAEKLLRTYLQYRNRQKTSPRGFQGFPRILMASTGEEAEATVDYPSSAMVALAAQLHIAFTGSREFLDLAEAVAGGVLLPLVNLENGGIQLQASSSDVLRVAALGAAVFRNQAEINLALGNQVLASRYQQAEELLVNWLLEDCWKERQGVFAAGSGAAIDAESNLLCLAVLSPRLSQAMIFRAVRSLEANFGMREVIRERYDFRPFRGNWFLNGFLDAHNRCLIPLSEYLEIPLPPELEPSDAWFFLNQTINQISGGRLGFSAEVRGLALDSTKSQIGFVPTAQAFWILNLLGLRIQRATLEPAEEIYELANRYGSELDRCTISDGGYPEGRSWPFHVCDSEVARDPRNIVLRERISTEPACYWIFGRTAKLEFLDRTATLTFHPFVPADFGKLRKTTMEGLLGELFGLDSGDPQTWRLVREKVLEELIAAERESLKRLQGQPARAPAVPAEVLRSLWWLLNQLNVRTGLLPANLDPARIHASSTYSMALVIIQFALAGALSGDGEYLLAAHQLWESMQAIRGEREKGWLDFYDVRTGSPYPDPGSRATGPNSWMVLAGLHLYHAAGKLKMLEEEREEILEEAKETLDWVLSFQIGRDETRDSYGAIKLSQKDLLSISTEANADALAAAWGFAKTLGREEGSQEFQEAARKIAQFLTTKVWRKGEGQFEVSFTLEDLDSGALKIFSNREKLDSQTWTILSLAATREAHSFEPRDYNGLFWISGEHTVEVPYREKTLRGFAKLTGGAPAFWPEGVAGYVLAARLVGMPEEPYLESLEAAREFDGTLLHIIGTRNSGDWKENTPFKAVDGTVWATWADPALNFNPFRTGSFGDPRPPAREPAPERVKEILEEGRQRLEELEKQKRQFEEKERQFRQLRDALLGPTE